MNTANSSDQFCDTCSLRTICPPKSDVEQRIEQHFTENPDAGTRAATIAALGTDNPETQSRCPTLRKFAMAGMSVDDDDGRGRGEWKWWSSIEEWYAMVHARDHCEHIDACVNAFPTYDKWHEGYDSDDDYTPAVDPECEGSCDDVLDARAIIGYANKFGAGMSPCGVCGKPFDHQVRKLTYRFTEHGRNVCLPVCSDACMEKMPDVITAAHVIANA